MTQREAIVKWLMARGIEPSRTPEDFAEDANGIIKALSDAGYRIVADGESQMRPEETK